MAAKVWSDESRRDIQGAHFDVMTKTTPASINDSSNRLRIMASTISVT